jgi:opacity protein-like surface antigen
MKVFKKVAMMLVVATAFAMNVSAQEKGDMAAGLGAAVGMGDALTNFGIGAKFQYNVTSPIRLEGSFTYFLPKDQSEYSAKMSIGMWDLSITGHYLFSVSEGLSLYPLAGIGMLGVSTDAEVDLGGYGYGAYEASASTTNFGFNLGGGIDFALSEKLVLNGQLKYMLASDWSRLIISDGVAYKF